MSFPEKIFIKRDNKFVEYHKDYEHEKGGCYYRNDNEDDWMFGNGISLYPDGHLTYLWNGREEIWNTEYKLQEV